MRKNAAIRTLVNSVLDANEEKRGNARISLQAKVSMQLEDRIIEGDLVNISVHGALVTSDTPIGVNTEMTITIFDTPTSRLIAGVKATAIRTTGNAIGLRFDT